MLNTAIIMRCRRKFRLFSPAKKSYLFYSKGCISFSLGVQFVPCIYALQR